MQVLETKDYTFKGSEVTNMELFALFTEIENEYEKDALTFLQKTKTDFHARLATYEEYKDNNFFNGGEKYMITLSNARHTYSFVFTNSVHAKQNNEPLSTYDVLSCLSLMYCDDIDEFCNEFGYTLETHKISEIQRIYDACVEQDKNINLLFTEQQIEMLHEIA